MNHYLETAKQLFGKTDNLDIDTVLHLMYYFYGNRSEIITEEMSCSYDAIKDSIKHLDFQGQDSILCAVNALSAHYERTAFCDGLVTGENLILGLLEQKE